MSTGVQKPLPTSQPARSGRQRRLRAERTKTRRASGVGVAFAVRRSLGPATGRLLRPSGSTVGPPHSRSLLRPAVEGPARPTGGLQHLVDAAPALSGADIELIIRK